MIQYLQVETRWVRNQLHTAINFNKGKRKVIVNFINNIAFTIGLPIIIISFILDRIPYTFIYIWIGWFFFIMLLNLSKPLYVYKFTSNKIYLKYIWLAMIFPFIDYILGFYAIITFKKGTLFFKGPRKI